MTARAFEIVSAEDCQTSFANQQTPNANRALPVTRFAWQRLHGGRLTEYIEPWWLDVALEPTNLEATSCLWVAPDLPCFAGHFPGQPILPGVMQLEWGARLANRLWPNHAPTTAFAGSTRVKFKAPITPDCLLQLSLVLNATNPAKQERSISLAVRSSTAQLTTAQLLYRV